MPGVKPQLGCQSCLPKIPKNYVKSINRATTPPSFEGGAYKNKKKKYMANSIYRDKKRRILYSKYEVQRNTLKAMVRDFTLSKTLRFQYMQELNNLPRNSALSRTRNRCIVTGRAKSNYQFFKISRITLRELASQGLLPGVTKSSW